MVLLICHQAKSPLISGEVLAWEWWNWESISFSHQIFQNDLNVYVIWSHFCDCPNFKAPLVAEKSYLDSSLFFNSFCKKTPRWPRRDLNTQPSDLESDALPLRHEVKTRFWQHGLAARSHIIMHEKTGTGKFRCSSTLPRCPIMDRIPLCIRNLPRQSPDSSVGRASDF